MHFVDVQCAVRWLSNPRPLWATSLVHTGRPHPSTPRPSTVHVGRPLPPKWPFTRSLLAVHSSRLGAATIRAWPSKFSRLVAVHFPGVGAHNSHIRWPSKSRCLYGRPRSPAEIGRPPFACGRPDPSTNRLPIGRPPLTCGRPRSPAQTCPPLAQPTQIPFLVMQAGTKTESIGGRPALHGRAICVHEMWTCIIRPPGRPRIWTKQNPHPKGVRAAWIEP